jgi:cell division GTPase FtsZ
LQVLGDDVSVLDALRRERRAARSRVGCIAEVINNAGLVIVDFADVAR